MDRQFWFNRWETNKIGFHRSTVNPALVSYIKRLALGSNDRLFLPLCGKTVDIGWLLKEGFYVAGVELSELAITQLFTELNVEPCLSVCGQLKKYSTDQLDIFVGDIFDLTSDMLGVVDAVYDRAALVALTEVMRKQYTSHLTRITGAVQQLLLTFEYNQGLMDGPPFSVSKSEVREHYQNTFSLQLLAEEAVPGGLKGVCPAQELVWHLT